MILSGGLIPLFGDHALAAVDKLAVFGVNGRIGHFAIAGQQSQHIDQSIAMMAEPGSHQFDPAAMRTQGLYGLSERNGTMLGDRRALFGLIQAGIVRGVGG